MEQIKSSSQIKDINLSLMLLFQRLRNITIFSQDGKYLTFESDRTIWAVEFNPIFDQIIQAKRIAYGVDPKFSKDNKSITVVALPTQNSKRAIMEVNIPNALSK